ncbi:hypothetical protein Taro_034568 [Colocasia esculenta]|uniref:Uncharacterized protein n=1 Tax=Colocasia esculenta TaxID=4460 RepID=A0A843WFV7_COLES|nr:hypothetical protein [Colocasia esculenta]
MWCLGSKCVDTTGYCFRTGFWDSEVVSTHRCTVSTPQADCVDTTRYCFRTGFYDSELVSTHRLKKITIIPKNSKDYQI